MKKSCHTYEGVMSHIWRSHVTHMKESCHTYEGVMSHEWRSHVTHMNEPCHKYEGVMSHIWRSHVTHMYESRCKYQRDTSHVTHVTQMSHTHTGTNLDIKSKEGYTALDEARSEEVREYLTCAVCVSWLICVCTCVMQCVAVCCSVLHVYTYIYVCVYVYTYIIVCVHVLLCAHLEILVWLILASRETILMYVYIYTNVLRLYVHLHWEVGGWGRDPKKCTGRDWGMGSSTIQWNLRPVVKYQLRRGVGFMKFLENGSRPQPPTSPYTYVFEFRI